MFAHDEFFLVLAELALVLAGFAGVTASFSGKDRSFRATEGLRLQGLFNQSALVLVGCLTLYCCLVAGLSESAAIVAASAVGLAQTVAFQLPRLRTSYVAARDNDSTSEPWALHTAAFIIGVQALLFIAGVLVARPWLLAVVYSTALLFCLWLFYRLLTRPN